MGNVPEKNNLLGGENGKISLPIKIGKRAFGFVSVENCCVKNGLSGDFIFYGDLLGVGEKDDKKEQDTELKTHQLKISLSTTRDLGLRNPCRCNS